MTTKTINIIYWVSTVIFAALMIFSSVGGLKPNEQTLEMLHKGMGYPVYFIQFISVAKLLGSITILIPGLKRIKEWAYAGLFFDLTGAVYSGIAMAGAFDPRMFGMLAFIIPGIISYYFWHQKMQTKIMH